MRSSSEIDMRSSGSEIDMYREFEKFCIIRNEISPEISEEQYFELFKLEQRKKKMDIKDALIEIDTNNMRPS